MALLCFLLLIAQSAAAPVAPPPAAPPTDWPYRPGEDDYPAAALRNDEQGKTSYRIEIGPDGRVSRCTITGSSGSATLDAATCRLLRTRTRFVPAQDSEGHPVPDTRDGDITWRLPLPEGD
jgi:protein TonB